VLSSALTSAALTTRGNLSVGAALNHTKKPPQGHGGNPFKAGLLGPYGGPVMGRDSHHSSRHSTSMVQDNPLSDEHFECANSRRIIGNQRDQLLNVLVFAVPAFHPKKKEIVVATAPSGNK
jgi:hypothetical protein